MSRPFEFAGLLLMSSALVSPSVAHAQAASDAAPPSAAVPPAGDAAAAEAPPEETVDVSIPGATNEPVTEIVVTGRRTPNIAATAPQVVSILSSADIARTGEGNIAGALGRVTGLSVVGNGFVYVRGLGDRYSLALLNGSPLPSPEPLKRSIPLDLFPSSVIASSLVQKTYSANFPGEFGGGVINLTTKAIPKEPFLSVGGNIGANSETTNELGYVYYGSRTDGTGFDNGARNTPPALAAYFRGSTAISSGRVNTQDIASQLVTGRQVVVQRNRHLPPNGGATITGGTTFDLGGDTSLGVIATLGYSNKWRTRDTLQQTSQNQALSATELNFQRVITDDRVVVNGLLGFGLEFGDNKVRFTNLYIRDTLKQARLGIGTRNESGTATLLQQNTAWFERQLIDSQFVSELKLADDLRLDIRGGYANSRREAPNEFNFEYSRSNNAADPFGALFINRLNNGSRGSASVSNSVLNENVYSASADLSLKITPDITATVGYAYTDTIRRTERRDLLFIAPSTFPNAVALFRPDLLLEPTVVRFYGITLVDGSESSPVFLAKLLNHAAYGQIQASIAPGLSLNAGVRYEVAKQSVSPVRVFTGVIPLAASTNLRRNYLLPAATITYELADKMQIRINASKTIARPQFRELIFQPFFDPDSNRQYRGNPLLTDSQLYNGEVRYEWYFARDQRVSAAAFYKKIDRPIETFVASNPTVTSFANAPSANLYGFEVETQKYFSLDSLGSSPFFASRRAVVVANYTYTKSKIKVSAADRLAVFALSSTSATDYFRDGAPLTGQSDHLVNLQIGLEDTDKLSQQTLLFTYASKRVTSRGEAGQPDIIEKPGIQLDFVARQGVKIAGTELELKFEVRNITGTKYQEFQSNGANRIYYNLYKVGTTASFGVTANF